MTTVNQKEYLKKYLGIGKGLGEKKKKKKSKKTSNGLKIVDDDVDIKLDEVIQADLQGDNEEAPQIVSIIDDRPPSLRIDEVTRDNLWKPIGAPDVTANTNKNLKFEGNLKISSSTDTKQSFSKRTLKKSLVKSNCSPPRGLEKDIKRFNPSRTSSDKRYAQGDFDIESSIERKIKKDPDDDSSPPRRNKHEDSSNSPPRKSMKYVHDSSYIKEIKREKSEDISPPRQIRKEENDMSPPRKSRRRDNEDNSPPRRNKICEDRGEDISPPRRNKTSGDISPPRRRKREESDDMSPPRKDRRRITKNNSPPRPNKKNEDNSPPRRNKTNKSADSSPARSSRPKNVESSPARNRKRSRWADTEDSEERSTKTLDGKKAGLQNALDLGKEMNELKKKEDELFKNMKNEISGANAATVVRNKNKEVNWEEEEMRRKKEEENKEKYNRWGKGLKQVDDVNEKIKNELYEMSKPLARYADDEDLEKYLKEQERAGDPMLAYLRKKKKKKAVEEGKPVAQQYMGDAPPNRFGIRPGYRWDGVDRSTGYEKQWFEVQNTRQANIEESYKWSTEDM